MVVYVIVYTTETRCGGGRMGVRENIYKRKFGITLFFQAKKYWARGERSIIQYYQFGSFRMVLSFFLRLLCECSSGIQGNERP